MNHRPGLRFSRVCALILCLFLFVPAANAVALQISMEHPADFPDIHLSSLFIDSEGKPPMSDALDIEFYDASLDWNDDGIGEAFSPAYCVDFYGYNDMGVTYTATTAPLESFAGMVYAAWLVDTFSTRIGTGYAPGVGSVQESELALQLAVWAAIYAFDETTATFGSNFSFTAPTVQAGALYGEYTGSLSSFVQKGGVMPSFLYSDYTVVIPEINGSGNGLQAVLIHQPVPEPSTLVLLGGGLLLFLRSIRRRVRQDSV